jgi:hypothetical protein
MNVKIWWIILHALFMTYLLLWDLWFPDYWCYLKFTSFWCVWHHVVEWVVLTLHRDIEPSPSGSSSVAAESWKLIQYSLSKCQELLFIQRLEYLSSAAHIYFLKSEKFSRMSGRDCQEKKSEILQRFYPLIFLDIPFLVVEHTDNSLWLVNI